MRDTTATRCQHPDTTVGVTYWPNGSHVVWIRCDDCGSNARGNGKWLAHTYDNWRDLPVFEDRRRDRPPCQVCGEWGTEIHHWAPKELFGDEADLWPTAYLCPPCHGRWHVEINKARLARQRAAG